MQTLILLSTVPVLCHMTTGFCSQYGEYVKRPDDGFEIAANENGICPRFCDQVSPMAVIWQVRSRIS